MKKAILIVALVMLSATLLGGCFPYMPAATGTPGDSASPAASPSPSIEPKDLISKAEAEGLVGNALTAGETTMTPSAGIRLCFYDRQDNRNQAARFFQISVTQSADLEGTNQTPRSIFDALKTGSTPVPVTGIGDEAFITPPGLHIMAEGYYLTIAVGDPENTANRDVLKAAGQKAVENLKALLEK